MTLIAILFCGNSSFAYQLGQKSAALFIPALFLLGILKCISLMQRPTTSRLCVIALLLTLSGWFLVSLGHVLTLVKPEWAGVLMGIFGVLNVLFNLAAFIVAIVGLATYDTNRFTQGRVQAVSAIVMNLLILAAGFALAVTVIQKRTQEHVASGKSGEPVRNEEFNFSIVPISGWRPTNPKLVNDLACCAFRHFRPEGYMMVIAEHLDGYELEDYMEVVKENLNGAATSVRDDSISEIQIGGIRFMKRSCVADIQEARGIPFYYEQYVATRPGFAWQIMFWCKEKNRAQLMPEFEKTIQSFRVLDESRSVPSAKSVVNVDRPATGYRTALDAHHWRAWSDGPIPLADFSAIRSTDGMLVLPVTLPSADVSREDVLHAILERLDIPYPDEKWEEKAWHHAWGEGLEITGTHVVDKTSFNYIIRFAQRGKLVHLHAGWSQSQQGDLEMVRKALDAIELLPGEDSGPVVPDDDAKKKSMAFVLNSIGIRLYGREQFTQAAGWFLEALGFAPDDQTILGNYLDALSYDGRSKQALEFLTGKMDSYPASPELHLRHAHLLADTGEPEAGNKAFFAAIDAGLKNEDEVLEWLKKLNNSEEYPHALAAAEAWMSKFPSVKSRRWHAQILAYMGQMDKAIECLEQLHKEFPDDRPVTYDLAEVLNSANEHARSATLAEKLLADGKENHRALMVLGWSQMGRKWYRDAKATFEKPQKNSPTMKMCRMLSDRRPRCLVRVTIPISRLLFLRWNCQTA